MFEFTLFLAIVCPLAIFVLIIIRKRLPYGRVKSGDKDTDFELGDSLINFGLHIGFLSRYFKFMTFAMLATAFAAQAGQPKLVVAICVMSIISGILFVIVFLGDTLGFLSLRYRKEVIDNLECQNYVRNLHDVSKSVLCFPALFVICVAVLLWIYLR